MSEYQYYEFRAVDRPLTRGEQARLRSITSRGRITPHSLINEYHWGDFKGDMEELMGELFDAHLYFANWGSRRLMLRLPEGVLDPRDVEPYLVEYAVDAWEAGGRLVVDWGSSTEDPADLGLGGGGGRGHTGSADVAAGAA